MEHCKIKPDEIHDVNRLHTHFLEKENSLIVGVSSKMIKSIGENIWVFLLSIKRISKYQAMKFIFRMNMKCYATFRFSSSNFIQEKQVLQLKICDCCY